VEVKGENMAPAYMNINSSDLTAAQIADMESTAKNFGLDPEFIAECLNKYGPDVLSLCVEAIKGGFSVGFVMELFRLFGPIVLDFVISLFTKSKSAMLSEQKLGVAASDIDLSDFLNEKNAEKFAPIIINLLLEKIVPYIIEKYGQQILQGLLDAVLSALKEKESARFLALLNR
jgi:hypothetical protein